MKDGSRGDYGLRALVYLAARAEHGKPVQIHAIAERQQIPEDYLRQLLVQLRAAGLVKSVRGPHGGYLLAKTPLEISMGEVIEVLEGAPEQIHYQNERLGEADRLDIVGADHIRTRFNHALSQMQAILHQTTLADLVAESSD
ncbi:MAG: Rrf2 family transcriptional regulator [Deltaproteobacteria bacterium]|jgi:Rrf2 family transcriptional regulator, cysteine metabolism repressor|nr:Rrf2 family transcriptional regulator [Deltaproteobacteria bacterium]MBT6435023.1 Rrf2 family transcriptional regulator [Deltaproteobacteria bacterium]MBT6489944.1 Rrf2 family transcriptional regulator [Deltaproteobacteria bacterium]